MIKHEEIKLKDINFDNLESKKQTAKIALAYFGFFIGICICIGALIISFVGL